MSLNPFLEDPVIRAMLEEADTGTLKILREMNDNWNRLDIKELTWRALQGQMRAVNFTYKSQVIIDGFLEDTCANPQLYPSFRLQFPDSLNELDLTFFSNYSLIYLTFFIYKDFKFLDHVYKYWLNILNLVSPHLKELKIKIFDSVRREPVEVPCTTPVVIQPVFPKLTQLACKSQNSDFEPRNNDIWWNQLMKPFLEKSQKFDPTPALINLEISTNIGRMDVIELTPAAISRWRLLTDLNIIFNRDLNHSERIMGALLVMAGKGLALKALKLTIFSSSSNDWNGNIGKLSPFLDTQAKSLLILNFIFKFWNIPPRDIYLANKIKLPNFESVHSLKIHVESFEGPVDTSMFEMDQLPVHFPNLNCFEVDHDLLPTLYLDGLPAKSLPLKRLCIHLNQYYIRNKVVNLSVLSNQKQTDYDQFVSDFDFDGWKEWLRTKFESVEVFQCIGGALDVDGDQLPWKDTLKELTIMRVNAPIKVSYLSNLRKVSVIRAYEYEEDYEVLMDNEVNPAEYLAFFQDLLSLPLSSITFDLGKKSRIPEYVKKLESNFPFPVKFYKFYK